MQAQEILEQARETIGAKRVYSEPYEKNGVTVITAARVMGGMGAGDAAQTGDPGKPTGVGGGFGMMGGPAGAFVIQGNDVKWMPAIDVNRLMLGFQIAMIVFLLVVRSVSKSRAPKA